jgi:hypothetical protein
VHCGGLRVISEQVQLVTNFSQSHFQAQVKINISVMSTIKTQLMNRRNHESLKIIFIRNKIKRRNPKLTRFPVTVSS